MQTHRRVFVFILAILWTSTTHAQSLRAARDSYDRALRHFAKGEFDAAIADFTRAIEINSHPGGDHRPQQQEWNTSKDFTNEAADSSRIVFVDPLTAAAYG